ncbi:MAG: signal peptidase I [Chthonomonadaceae bacterium]|nr:signal peptidase I [Chthonomonadaceae bacterium]
MIVVFLFVFTFRLGIVRGESMMPTYQNGQSVLVRRQSFLNSKFKRGDVVVLQKGRDVIIKRVAYLPGEEVKDPALVNVSYVRDLLDYYEQSPRLTSDGKKSMVPRIFVPAGFIVVLGDNPAVSEDSRFFGPVPLRDVLGNVIASPPAPAGLTPANE